MILFSALEKMTILLFEQNKPTTKVLFKDTFKPQKCGSSVKLNGISDGVYFGIATK